MLPNFATNERYNKLAKLYIYEFFFPLLSGLSTPLHSSPVLGVNSFLLWALDDNSRKVSLTIIITLDLEMNSIH